MARYKTYLCGDSICPHDDHFVHLFNFGCVPKDFNDRTGRSKTRRQSQSADGRYKWNGGCDAAKEAQS